MDFFLRIQKQDRPVCFAVITVVLMYAFKIDDLPTENQSIKNDFTQRLMGFMVSGLLMSKWSKNRKRQSFVFAIH